MNSALKRLKTSGNNAIDNDITIAASEICLQMLSDKLKLALTIIFRFYWCREFKSTVNPSKTDTIIFTKRYKIPNFTHTAHHTFWALSYFGG